MKQPRSRDETLWRQDFAAKNGALASAAWLTLAHSLREQSVFLSGGWRARWEGGGSLFSIGPGSHYFHVADWGMERGGIMSRRYSRWRSTAEEVLCTAKLGLTNARAPPVLRGAFFQLEVALLLPALTALSECLPVLLTRAVAEAAFCSLGD